MEAVRMKETAWQQHSATQHQPQVSACSLLERFCCKAIEIPRDLTVGDRNLTCQLAVAGHSETANINKAKISTIQTQHHDISRSTHVEVAQLFAMNNFCGCPRRARDHFVECHPEVEELRHDVQHILHSFVHATRVKVGADGVRSETLLNSRNRYLVRETSSTVTDIKDDPALLRLLHEGLKLAVLHDRHSSLYVCKAVREDVTGS